MNDTATPLDQSVHQHRTHETNNLLVNSTSQITAHSVPSRDLDTPKQKQPIANDKEQ